MRNSYNHYFNFLTKQCQFSVLGPASACTAHEEQSNGWYGMATKQGTNSPGREQIHGLEKSCTQGIYLFRAKFPRNKFTGEQIPSHVRFTLADPMPPDAVGAGAGGESGSTHPMHARVAPGHRHHSHWPTRPRIVCRSGSGVVFIMIPFPVYWYLFDSRRTCFVQHLQIQSFTHTLLFLFLCSLVFFKFIKTSAPPADKNTCHQT